MNRVPETSPPVSPRTGERLAAALLGYFVLVTLVITLSPFDFGPARPTLYWLTRPRDIVLNVVLFLPVGFLLGSLGQGRWHAWRALAFAAAFSLGIEGAQVFLPSRYVSAIDVVTNTLGGFIGIQLRRGVERTTVWRPQVVGRMGLDGPVVGLVYLVVPQLWLGSVGLADDPWHGVTLLLLGCAGTAVLATLYRDSDDDQSPRAVSTPPQAMLWFVVGALPAVAGASQTFGAAAATMVCGTWWYVHRRGLGGERRVEAAALRRFLPLFVAYLVVASLWPIVRPLVGWHGAVGFLDGLRGTSIVGILFLLEQVGAFTLLGYALAEWRGRDEVTLGGDLPRVLRSAAALAIALEVVQGFLSGGGASVLRALLSMVAAMYGAAVYHLARTHVQYLRSVQPDVASADTPRAA